MKFAIKFFVSSFCILVMISACVPTPTPEPTPTITLAPSDTPTPAFTSTPTKTITPEPTFTATPNATATQQYLSFLEIVQKYYKNGWISSDQGKYKHLEDVHLELAKAGNYKWISSGIKAGRYVVRTTVTMKRSGPISTFSGCGIKYDTQMYFLGQDGKVSNVVGNTVSGQKFYKAVPNPAEYQFTLIVNQTASYFFIDGKWLLSDDVRKIAGANYFGEWGMAVISGTSEGSGTVCEFKDIEYWAVKTP